MVHVRVQGSILRHHWTQMLRPHHRMLVPSIHAAIPFTGIVLKQALPKWPKRQLLGAPDIQTTSPAFLAKRECHFPTVLAEVYWLWFPDLVYISTPEPITVAKRMYYFSWPHLFGVPNTKGGNSRFRLKPKYREGSFSKGKPRCLCQKKGKWMLGGQIKSQLQIDKNHLYGQRILKTEND